MPDIPFQEGERRAIFVFDSEGDVILENGDTPPSTDDLEKFTPLLETYGRTTRDSEPCDLWALFKREAAMPDGLSFVSRRALPALLGYDFFNRAGIAYQMMNLTAHNKYCGVCGGAMSDHAADRARVCGACGNMVYCAMSPAVIVAVEKGDMLLMGRGVNFPPGRYSVLAGFVEPGETLEETIVREIYEESSVRVKNITYFGSQPWPFPNSLMLAFRAEWESGEPTPDGAELTDVKFFKPDEIPPELPPGVSISRRLIDSWLAKIREALI
ncbi:MAG: NAD(+) diphosphatase [Synergistaceae bacterium]|nr:NAD(+) diphosphatase [Synergistaceae bacterium]